MLEKENLKQALQRVQKNKGAPGIDKMTVESLPAYLAANWTKIREQLKNGKYEPSAVRRVEIPKPGGGVRQLGIPCVLDRFIQQALQQVLQREWDPTFSPQSYGFRPGKSQHQAVKQAQKYVSSGLSIVVDIDLEKFFDRVNHDVLMSRIAKRVEDKRVLKLIRAYLNAGIMENGLISPSSEGVPQGGPLSPLLSNLMLDELDKELEARNLAFVRYADDCNIYVSSVRAGERVMQGITKFLAKKLRLKVNEAKSAVGKPQARKFLGFSFTGGRAPKLKIAPASIKAFRARIRQLTRRNRGKSIEDVVKELNIYMKGWINYFGICQTPSVLEKLQGWIRRKLRCIIWKRWRVSSTRFVRLRALGLSTLNATEGAGNGAKGPWRMSKTPPLSMALSNQYFRSLGLPDLKCKGA
ncbi:group II intron reverse transcriptase/maturase [Candidatus Obscuribacterales bacterium]|nr:group II intron reverse transcriptase/maturase [Candidatus Obscuribacterales bacterium]